jgi:hypothetical protein
MRRRRVESPAVAESVRRNARVETWIRRELKALHPEEYRALLDLSHNAEYRDKARYEAFKALRERYRAEYEELRALARRREWEAAS